MLPLSESAAAASPISHVVLVVDDAPETLRMLCDALALEGYTVLVARDATEALERFEMGVPDAVLLDALMPGEDGFSLCRRLKAEPSWAHVPVIFMTGLAETEQILQGFACGGVDYVVKPLRIPEVLARLATHLRNAHVSRLAREAVDVAGLGVLLLDSQGRVAWRSPQATRWLQQIPALAEGEAAVRHWLLQLLEQGEALVTLSDGSQLQARHLGPGGPGERMVLLRHLPLAAAEAVARDPSQRRLSGAALTPRETEVLSWLAKGKTNRDIGDILGMSPRTVNKHLEHIFEKLGVETRTAAAAIASSLLLED
ncbi:response regulator transcription factor [Hylemonella gracilis]|uniref:Two component LuxR family transcriptional regulator n=1 Tax=Hylemonella gracilis ATCC 19624 TaxID=887062 RepID=F3KP21_9BURK|nr:DNA-binding response regulator [Hylemonella gracilis]EGI78422.1 two component LuxR family transcriptional regulator [Hylemonella gracilis ATCC 19624]